MGIGIFSRGLRLARWGRRGGARRAPERRTPAQDRLWLLHDSAVGSRLSDEEILAAVDDFKGTLKTNCGAAAEALLVGVAPICAQRPGLVRALMTRALHPLFCLGYERSEEVKRFVEWSLSNESAPIPHGDASRSWLAGEFSGILDLIQELLDEMSADAARPGP